MRRIENLRTAALHEIGTYTADLGRITQIDGHIEAIFADKALPASIAMSPTAHIAIHQRLFASCRIIAVVSMVIGNLGTHSLVLHRLHLLLALTNLLLQIEWVHAFCLQMFHLRQGTGLELRIVLGLGSVPSYLSQSQGTRIKHILGILWSRNMLGPEICLNTRNHIALRLWKIASRHVAVHLLGRNETAICHRLGARRILIHIEVAVSSRRHHYIIAMLDRLVCQFGATPNHHGGILGEISGNHLVPSHELSAMLVQELAHVGNQMSLQSIHMVDAQLLHLLLTEGTTSP